MFETCTNTLQGVSGPLIWLEGHRVNYMETVNIFLHTDATLRPVPLTTRVLSSLLRP